MQVRIPLEWLLVYLLRSYLLPISLLVDREDLKALLDSSAPIIILNRAMVDSCHITRRKAVQMQGYDGPRYHAWTELVIRYQAREIRVKVLVTDNVHYATLLVRPDTRKLQLNIDWEDDASTDVSVINVESVSQRLVMEPDEIQMKYPELFYARMHPPTGGNNAPQSPVQSERHGAFTKVSDD